MSMQRVWVVLQNNQDGFLDSTDVVGVYSSPTQAEKVRAKCMELYTQYYYVQDVLLDADHINK
jgi:hypothetical protein